MCLCVDDHDVFFWKLTWHEITRIWVLKSFGIKLCIDITNTIMGRDISWYVFPKVCEHDTSKPLCLNIEFEPESDEKNELIYYHFHPEHDYTTKYENNIQTDIRNIAFDYMYSEEKKDEWCPLCKLYMTGVYNSPLVLAHHHIRHSYSNPIWNSDWNVKRLQQLMYKLQVFNGI